MVNVITLHFHGVVKTELLIKSIYILNVETKTWLTSVPLQHEFGSMPIVKGWVYTDKNSCKDFMAQLTECTNTMIIGDWS